MARKHKYFAKKEQLAPILSGIHIMYVGVLRSTLKQQTCTQRPRLFRRF